MLPGSCCPTRGNTVTNMNDTTYTFTLSYRTYGKWVSEIDSVLVKTCPVLRPWRPTLVTNYCTGGKLRVNI